MPYRENEGLVLPNWVGGEGWGRVLLFIRGTVYRIVFLAIWCGVFCSCPHPSSAPTGRGAVRVTLFSSGGNDASAWRREVGKRPTPPQPFSSFSPPTPPASWAPCMLRGESQRHWKKGCRNPNSPPILWDCGHVQTSHET